MTQQLPSFRRAENCLLWENPTYDKKMRFLIITLGPTGSGKSTMATQLMNYARRINGSAARAEWSQKVLDDYVEESPEYKIEMDKIISKIEEKVGGRESLIARLNEIDGCSIYSEPWHEFARECTEVYFRVRTPIDPAYKNKVDLFNNAFHESLQVGKNIIFEITGRNMLTTIEALNALAVYTNDCEKYNYIILAGYNVTDYYSLQNRNIDRFTHAMKKYLRDGNAKPPRLPWIGCFNPENPGLSFCNALNEIKTNILSLVTKCGKYRDGQNIVKYSQERCIYDSGVGLVPNDRPDFNPNGLAIDILFIFNNIYKKIKLIAKIPISERSISLVGASQNLKIFPEENDINKIIELLRLYGPLERGDQFLDVCGSGLPIYSSEKSSNIVEDDFVETSSKIDGGKKKLRKKVTSVKKRRKKKYKTLRRR